MKNKTKKQADVWQNRIVGSGTRAAKDFVLNPRNFRTHSENQKEAMSAILTEVGWVQRVVVNRRTGNVIDGELRVRNALAVGENTLVPFVEVDLSEEEELKVLAVFDRISAMAGVDAQRLEEISSLIDFDSSILDSLLSSMLTEEVNLDEFFEANLVSDLLNEAETEPADFTIFLKFETEEEMAKVSEGLNKINANPAGAVCELLRLKNL